ncbi:MAG: PqqD family protein [Gemmatimonadetes bacterium]|nr:PqqD family protein [Gemmatimonadota bacterium]
MLVNLESGHYFSLNVTGQFIWSRLDGKQDLGEVAAAVAAAFEVTREEALDDTLALAIELLREGLVDVIRAE